MLHWLAGWQIRQAAKVREEMRRQAVTLQQVAQKERERERTRSTLLRISHANTLEIPVDCIQHNGPIKAAQVGWS